MCGRLIIWALEVAISVMFWNVENYFDTADDIATLDEEFTPRGGKHWSRKRFERKRNGIAKVITAASCYGDYPVVIGLAEVENKTVLRRLVEDTPLEKLDYEFIHRDSPDTRGIDVALLYRKSRFRPLAVQPLRVSEEFRTRDILYVKGVLADGGPAAREGGVKVSGPAVADTIHIFVNHWPSKRGGAEVSDQRRLAAARTLTAAIDSIRLTDSTAFIVAMGDFNDTPDNVALPLSNLAEPVAARGEGTIKYRGNWEMIDQIFVSDTSCCAMDIFKPAFLMEPDRTYTGDKPRRTYIGPKHNGGLSDHLPVVLRIIRTENY